MFEFRAVICDFKILGQAWIMRRRIMEEEIVVDKTNG